MFYENISVDDATVALMAKHILRGEDLPAFFYGQSYMGSLNGFHLVPALAVFGPSVLLVRLNAVAWSLLFPLGLYVLAGRLYDEATARVTLLLAAVPPFLLTYYSTVAEPHFEANTFGVVLVLLALGALGAGPEPRRARILGCLGFVAGLACWTNMKVVVVLGPILVALLVQEPRLPLRRGGWLLAGGFVLGNLPAWLFYLTQPMPLPGSAASAQRFIEIHRDVSWAHAWEFLTRAVPLVIGTYYWGPDTLLRALILGLCGAIYAAAVVLAGIEAVRARRDRRGARRAWSLWLLLLILATTYLALYLSTFNILDDGSRGRYLLPAYIPLFLFLGAAVARLGRRSRALAGAALTFVLAFNLWTNLEFLWPLDPPKRAWRADRMAVREDLARGLRGADADVVLVDNNTSNLQWQFLLDRPPVSDFLTDSYYPSAVRADAVRRVAILAIPGDSDMAAQLGALGATATATRYGQQWLYDHVRIPGRAYRLVPTASWRSLGEAGTPPAVADGDLGTAWPPRRLDRSEAGALVLDLGATRAIARLLIWPTALTELIVPLEVAGSLDAVTWEPLGIAPTEVGRPAFVAEGRPLFRPRNGWLELATAPQPVRYLRVRPVEGGSIGVGMVGELRAYEAIEGPAPETPDIDAILHAVRTRGVRRLLGNPVVSARVALAAAGTVDTLPANRVLNSYGYAPPVHLFARVRLRETDAALVAGEDAGELRERLESAGVRVTTEPVGTAVLIQPVGPVPGAGRCRPTDWRVTATILDADGKGARYTVAGRLVEWMRLATLRVEHPFVSARYATILGVEISEDGRAWRPVPAPRPVPEWAWAGRTLFTFSGGATELDMGGVPARAVRVEVQLPYSGERAITALCARGEA